MSKKGKSDGKPLEKTTLENSDEEKFVDRARSDKICPLLTKSLLDLTDEDSKHTVQIVFCRYDCEWHDGEGCAIWRLVKALDVMSGMARVHVMGP